MSVEVDPDVPPVGEEIHLPGPTIIPFLNAVGISLIVVGTTLGAVPLIIGGVLFVTTTVKWIFDTRRDIAELPEEHSH